jgi:hypothetical protein
MRAPSVTLILAALFCLLFASNATADYDINEGLWEITVKVDMEGMPMTMAPVTNTQCITKDMLVPKPNQPGQECKIMNQKIKGNTLIYDIECSGPGGNMKGHGEATYTGNTMTGKMEANMPGQGDMKMITKMSGKRIGPCE